MRWSVLAAVACLVPPGVGDSAPEDGRTLARVGNEIITVEDLLRTKDRFRLRVGDHTPREMLQPLIDRKILKMEAEKRSLDKNPVSAAALEKARRQFLVEKLYEDEVSRKVAVSEEAVRAYFEQQGLDKKREVQASHIAVGTQEEALRLYRELQQGADFAALAKSSSTDTATASRGGDMGYWQEEDIPRSPFVRRLFALRPGEISEPYQDARGGYHLIKAVAERPVGFERQRERIRNLLERQQKDQRWRAYLEERAARLAFAADESTLAFLLRQGSRAVDLVPPIPPEHFRRVLGRFPEGEIDLGTYLDALKDTARKGRPTPADSEAVVQFARLAALKEVVLPETAAKQEREQGSELNTAWAAKQEEVLVVILRRTEVEDRIVTEERQRTFFEGHREEFAVPARTFVEGGILASLPQARTVAARVRGGEELARVMQDYPLFLGHWRKYDVFNFAPTDTTRHPGSLGAMIDAAKKMGSEEIAGPVPIDFEGNKVGYVILHILERQPARILPFTDPEVRETIRHKLRYEYRQEIEAAFEQYLAVLRQEYAPRTVVDERVLDTLTRRQ
jgi:peptidyl-prolyl cis-trans isomerase C